MKKITSISIIILLLITNISFVSAAQNTSIAQNSDNPYPEREWEYTVKICGIKNVTSIIDPSKIIEIKVALNKDETNIILTRKCDNTVYQASYTGREGVYLVYKAYVLAMNPADEGGCSKTYTGTYNSYFINASSKNYNTKVISMIVGYGTQPFFERTTELYKNPNSNTKTKQIMFNSLIFRFIEPFLQRLNIQCGLAY